MKSERQRESTERNRVEARDSRGGPSGRCRGEGRHDEDCRDVGGLAADRAASGISELLSEVVLGGKTGGMAEGVVRRDGRKCV